MNEDLQKQIEATKAELQTAQKELVDMKTEEAQKPETSESISEPVEQSIEDKAREMGWNPEHKGPNFVSAKEFVERGSFFRKIDAQNKKIDDLINVVNGLSEHNKKIIEASEKARLDAYNKGLQEALEKRRQAVEIGDVSEFEKAELELQKIQTSKPAPAPEVKQPPQEVSQDMLDFVKENEAWFNNKTALNKRMVDEMDGLFYLEMRDNPNLTHKEALTIAKEKVMKLHEHEFENPNKAKPIAVTKSAPVSTSGSKSGLAARLTETQKQFFKSATDAGLKMSIEDYAKQLDMTGDLRND
jgi:hypothetical protein